MTTTVILIQINIAKYDVLYLFNFINKNVFDLGTWLRIIVKNNTISKCKEYVFCLSITVIYFLPYIFLPESIEN